MNLHDVLAPLVSILERHRIAYAVIGGYAVAAWGELRATRDVDLFCSAGDLGVLKSAVGNPLFIPEAQNSQSLANALFAVAQHNALGYSPFSIESLDADRTQHVTSAYDVLREMPSEFRSSGCTCTNEIAILNGQSGLARNVSRPGVVSCVRQPNPESEHQPAGLGDPALS